MAKRAFLTSKALNFLYKIRTEEFIQSPMTYNSEESRYGSRYTVDLIVDKHPDYPDIPPSIWTMTLTVMDVDGKIVEIVEPKDGPQSLKSPSLVLVDWTVRTGRMGLDENIEHNPDRGDCHRHIGPEGFMPEHSESLSEMVECVERQPRRFPLDNDRRKVNAALKLGARAYVLVSLTFMVEKAHTSRVLTTLYESSMLTDCTLICGQREFSAHRAILAAQSPVFAAMFHSNMKEKLSGICTIKDVSPEVMDALLQFVYTEEVAKAEGQLEAVWTAGDKYDLPGLKLECERLMLQAITDDNALDYLYFAAQRGLNKLKVEAAKVISRQSV